MTVHEVSLRERTRRAVRAEIVEAAMSLFLSQGFESTTVEEIAQAAGISRRSYFRYFANKDGVFAEGLASLGKTFADTLAQRPRGEDPWLSLRRAFDPLVEQAESDPHAVGLGRLLLERPALGQGKDAVWEAELTATLTSRAAEDDSPDPLRLRALVGAAVACVHAAKAQWLAPDEHRSAAELLDTAMDAVHRLS